MHDAYALRFEREAGRWRVSCRDLPQLVTSDVDEAQAATKAAEALEVVVMEYIDRNTDLPDPSPAEAGERLVHLPAALAAKVAVWRAWRAAGISKLELSRRMGVPENAVRRILDPRYGTGLDKLDEAARALGVRLAVTAIPVAA